MNHFGAFLVTLATISQIGCLSSTDLNILDNSCDQNNIKRPNPRDILKGGFTDFNATIAAAENLAMNGLLQANSLVMTHPHSALQIFQDSIQDCQEKFFESGIPVLFSIGKALEQSNEDAREGLVEALSSIQLFSLKAADTMRTATSLAMQGMRFGGGASRQVIQAMSQDLRADLKVLYNQIPISLQKSIESVSKTQGKSKSSKDKKQNTAALASDPDASAAISDLYKASNESVRNGSDENKVKKLRDSIVSLLGDMAETSSLIGDNFLVFENSVHLNPSLAVNSFLENSEALHKRIQGIFTNICLEFGIAAGDLSEKDVANAFIIIEHANDDVSYASKVGSEMAVNALKYRKDIRKKVLKAAEDVTKYGVITFYKNTVQSAAEIFQLL